MGLDFIILSLPRSGSTWAANWLSTESVFCAHDPLWTVHYDDFAAEVSRRAKGRVAGISCTGSWRWPRWLEGQAARKLILRRDVREIEESLARQGLPALPDGAADALEGLNGRHVDWTAMFDETRAAELWGWLTGGLKFDAERHAELVQCDVQPRLSVVKRDWRLNRRLGAELQARTEAGKWRYL